MLSSLRWTTCLDGVESGATNSPLTSSAPEDVTKATAAVGVATDAARADHKHDVSTATAGAATPGDSAAEGIATSLARSDHQHSLPAFGSTSTTFCEGNDSRLSDDRVASGLRSATTVVVVSTATAPSSGQVLTATSSTLASWATPPVYAYLTSSTPSDVTKSSAQAGSATDAARADHKHDISTAAAGATTPGDSTSEGTATSLARSDHKHSLPAFGSTSTTFCVGNDSRLSDDRVASGLRSATTVVSVASATAPTTGQVLTATSSTVAVWSDPTYTPLTSNAPADVTKATAAVGVGTAAARDDHKHDVSTAIAGAATPGDTAAEGTATSLARSDHKHSLPAFGSTSTTFCVGNDSRLSDDRVASGLRSATTVVSVASATAPTTGQVLTATSSTVAVWSDPTYTPLTSNAPADVTKATAAVGVGTASARDDHKHDVSTATAGSATPGDTAAEGTATSLARSDHKHSLPSFGSTSGTFCQGNDSRLSDDRTASGIRTATTVVGVSSATAPTAGQVLTASSGTSANWASPIALATTNPADVTKSAAITGVGTTSARADHKHDVSTATPATTAVVIGNSAAEGTATSLSRSDHQHTVSGGTPVAIGTTNSNGTATTFARSDHVHNHGAQTSGTLHAVATGSVNGFMSSTDKSKLDLMSPDFGRDYALAQSLGQSTTTATSFQTKVTLATGALTGTYIMTWYCLMSRPSGGNPISARFYNVTSSAVVGGVWSKDQLQVTDKLQFSGAVVITLSGTSNSFAIQYEGGGGNTAAIEEARIEMWRVSA